MISVSTAGTPGTLRVQVWRKLRSLGALYLQQSVCLLPARSETTRDVRRLADRVRHQGGTARVIQIELTDPAELAGIVAEFNTARDDEYTEVLERLPSLRAELESERARDRATYLEVEENEADLARFRTWLGKIATRDYFAAPVGDRARAALAAAAAELEAFEADALRAEAPPDTAISTSTAGPATGRDDGAVRLRVVDDSS